jgi:molybdopterin-guanine dinucleotide biosynthesis protein A
MGFDKASLGVDGVPLAVRLGRELVSVCAPAAVVEVGPGVSELPAVLEPGDRPGPLVAFETGLSELWRLGHTDSVLLVACDLPLLDDRALRMLAGWPGAGSVVPVVAGRPQPLAARWSDSHARMVPDLVRAGSRSMQALVGLPGVELIDEVEWSGLVPATCFTDVDTPADLDRLGLAWARRRVIP